MRSGAVRLFPVACMLALIAGLASTAARAADLGFAPAPERDGVPCESDETKSFDSVWLGHFSGGYSHALGPGLPIVLDWRDEKLCFPSRGSCTHHINVMRREFHRPEGDFTCLPIR